MPRHAATRRPPGPAACWLAAALLAGACDDPSPAREPPRPVRATVEPGPPSPAAEPPRPSYPTIGPGSDEPPTQPSTRADSELHAPTWAKGGLDVLPPDEAAAIFASLGSELVAPGRLAGAVIVCRASVTRWIDNHGIFNAPDLSLTLKLGDNPVVEARGPEDSHEMFVSMALATLAPDDTIRAQVRDRDILSDTRLGAPKGKYTGELPWTARGGRVTLECRALAGAALERVVSERLAICDRVLTDPNPAMEFSIESFVRFGYLVSGLGIRRGVLRRLATLVGWADPRLLRRLEWERRIERPVLAEAERFIQSTRDAAAPATRLAVLVPGQLRGRVEQWACGPEVARRVDRAAFSMRRGDAAKRGGCALRLEIESIGREALSVSTFITAVHGIAAPRLVLSDGTIVKLEPLALEGGVGSSTSRTLAPGTTGTLVLIPVEPFTPAAAPRPSLVVTGAEDLPELVWLPVP